MLKHNYHENEIDYLNFKCIAAWRYSIKKGHYSCLQCAIIVNIESKGMGVEFKGTFVLLGLYIFLLKIPLHHTNL